MGRIRTNKRNIDRVEEINRALELRVQGKMLREIADELDCGVTKAHQLIKDGMTGLYRENAEQLFQLQMERLDLGMRSIAPALEAGDPKAVNALVQLHDRYEKMYKLYGVYREVADSGDNVIARLAEAVDELYKHQKGTATPDE